MQSAKFRKITAYFIVSGIAVIAVFDCFVFINGGTEATISYTINQWSHEFPAMTFATGFVMGHLFWRTRDVKKKESE